MKMIATALSGERNFVNQTMTNRLKIVLLALCFIAAAGCASNGVKETKPASAEKPYKDKPEPTLGMSKEDVQKVWGKPKRVTGTPSGELWQYDDVELALIPFNFGFKPHFYRFTFDTSGKLVDYAISKHD